MQAVTDIGTLIVQTPGICGNRPRISGTRVTVQTIVIDFKAGMTPEDIVLTRLHLNQAQVYAALAHYHANKDTIDADIASYYENFGHLEVGQQAGQPG